MRVISEETRRKQSETNKRKMYERAEKEIGNKYNHLEIIAINYDKTEENYSKRYGPFFDCKCDCGNPKILTHRFNSIKYGHAKSCGCIKFNNPKNLKDLTGKKFGRLTVVERDSERDKNNKNNVTHWICKCDCGNIKSVTSYQLQSGKTKSCGCYLSEMLSQRNKKLSTKYNEIRNNLDGTISILDDNGNECLIDEEDYDSVKSWYWRKVSKRGNIDRGYWVTNVKKDDEIQNSLMFIHQIIAEKKFGYYDRKLQVPDHLSRDTDDNRKCNIMLKTNAENSKNRGLNIKNKTGKTGVYKRQNGKWMSKITVNYKTIYLGTFVNFNDAVKARKDAEAKYGFTCDDVVAEYDKEVINK